MEYLLVVKRAGGIDVGVFTPRVGSAVELEPLRRRIPLNVARV